MLSLSVHNGKCHLFFSGRGSTHPHTQHSRYLNSWFMVHWPKVSRHKTKCRACCFSTGRCPPRARSGGRHEGVLAGWVLSRGGTALVPAGARGGGAPACNKNIAG